MRNDYIEQYDLSELDLAFIKEFKERTPAARAAFANYIKSNFCVDCGAGPDDDACYCNCDD